MDEKDQLFLLAKVNLLEDLCTHQVALLSLLHSRGTGQPPMTLIDTLENNAAHRIRFGAVLREGDEARIDPIALQTEMLRQLGPIASRVRELVAAYTGQRPPSQQ